MMSRFPFNLWWDMVDIVGVIILAFLGVLFIGDVLTHRWRKRQARNRARKGKQ